MAFRTLLQPTRTTDRTKTPTADGCQMRTIAILTTLSRAELLYRLLVIDKQMSAVEVEPAKRPLRYSANAVLVLLHLSKKKTIGNTHE